MKFKNIQEAITHYVENKAFLQQALGVRELTENNVNASCLPDAYNDTPYDTIFNGHRVKTVGEYKRAIEKSYKYRG